MRRTRTLTRRRRGHSGAGEQYGAGEQCHECESSYSAGGRLVAGVLGHTGDFGVGARRHAMAPLASTRGRTCRREKKLFRTDRHSILATSDMGACIHTYSVVILASSGPAGQHTPRRTMAPPASPTPPASTSPGVPPAQASPATPVADGADNKHECTPSCAHAVERREDTIYVYVYIYVYIYIHIYLFLVGGGM